MTQNPCGLPPPGLSGRSFWGCFFFPAHLRAQEAVRPSLAGAEAADARRQSIDQIPYNLLAGPVRQPYAPSDSGLQSTRVAQRRRLKRLAQRLPFRPWLRFLYVYLWQRGFLDGREGYYFARLHGYYEFLSVAKTYELRERMNAGNQGRPV